jgi:hypothetical protein
MGVALAGGDALAQATVPEPASAAPAAMEEADEKAWSFSASAFTYFLPDEGDYVQPAFSADRGRLHLEARYNYEDRQTASAWIGYNLSFGEKLTLELTPMLGGVFGETDGIAPGYKLSLAWRRLELSSESEYVIDTAGSSESFFYTWSELAWGPADWCRLGLVVQRTKAYQTDFDIQRGLLAGVTYKDLDLTAYVFDPGGGQPTVVLGVSLGF